MTRSVSIRHNDTVLHRLRTVKPMKFDGVLAN